MIAILCQKPALGKDMARVLGANHKKKGYFEGNGYQVTWACGQLVSLALPEAYHTCIQVDELPLLPDPFKLVVRSHKLKAANCYATMQLEVIKSVFNACEQIIVATDPSADGERIFRDIYEYLGCTKPFLRLWTSSLTDDAIRAGMQNLKSGTAYEHLYLAADARAKADWLMGINASAALALCSGDQNQSLGRLQTPILSMICKRYLEHAGFKSLPYWQPIIQLSKEEDAFFVSGESCSDQQQANKVFERLKTYPIARIARVELKEEVVQPPLLHDLTSLQQEANRRFDFSAQKTLHLAQSLYEAKLISYPCTGSRYIPKDVFKQIPALIHALKKNALFGNYANMLSLMKLSEHAVSQKKLREHHALLITENAVDGCFKKLTSDEQRIYDLIAGRVLEAFSLPLVKAVCLLEICCDDLVFKTQTVSILEYGWCNVFKDKMGMILLIRIRVYPSSMREITYPICSYELVQKSTKPLPLFSEGSLLEELNNCGLGTPETRAGLIETLIKEEYITREKKLLIPTKRGLDVYATIKTMRIADVQKAAQWEKCASDGEKITSGCFVLEGHEGGDQAGS